MPLQFKSYQELIDRGVDIRAAWCEQCQTHEAHAYDKPLNRLTCVRCDTAQVYDDDIEILSAETLV